MGTTAVTQQQPDTAIVLKSKTDIERTLNEAVPDMAALVPQNFSPERLIKIFVSATDKNPELLKCSKKSWVVAFLDAAETGLDPSGNFLGEAALVPYSGQVQFQPMYKGLCKKARECAGVTAIDADTVRSGDEFEFYHATPEDHFMHRPALQNRGEVIGAWARAMLPNGRAKIIYYDKSEIERCRRTSKAANGPMWGQHYGEAAKKTVIKALCKTLPMTPEMAKVIDLDNAAETDANAFQPGQIRMPQRKSATVINATAETVQATPVEQPLDYSQDESPICDICTAASKDNKAVDMKFVPSGNNKQGKRYPAFWSCPNYKTCKAKTVVAKEWHDTLELRKAQQPENESQLATENQDAEPPEAA